MEEDIKILEEKVIALERHIKIYEEIDCRTAVYEELVKEKQATSNVLSRLKQLEKENKTLKNFTTDLFNEDVTETFIHKDEIKEKFDNKINDYRQQRMQLADGHFWESAENVNRDRVLFIAGETLKEFKKELLGEE